MLIIVGQWEGCTCDLVQCWSLTEQCAVLWPVLWWPSCVDGDLLAICGAATIAVLRCVHHTWPAHCPSNGEWWPATCESHCRTQIWSTACLSSWQSSHNTNMFGHQNIFQHNFLTCSYYLKHNFEIDPLFKWMEKVNKVHSIWHIMEQI